MTKKDYIIIAKAIKKEWENLDTFTTETEKSAGLSVLIQVVRNLNAELLQNNPNFDLERFSNACGWQR